MKSMITSSARAYKIAFIESDDIKTERFTLEELTQLNDREGADYEWKYALNEVIDKLLDLKQYENLVFQTNRDNPKSLTIVLRWI